MPPLWLLVPLSALTSLGGAIGGLGGAIFLVPILLVLGVDAREAAPLGMLSVAAGSLAAAPRQVEAGLVHHRLGVTVEVTAAAGAIVGALASDTLDATATRWVLAVVALGAAASSLTRRALRNPPDPTFQAEPAGEWPGTLGGTYHLDGHSVPYQARRVPAGLVSMTGAGLISGLAGVGGGFLKVPILTNLMKVPVRVAAATSTFTVGVTAAASLAVFTGQGRVDVVAGAAVVLGGVAGGILGTRIQARLAPPRTRMVLAALLVGVAIVLIVGAR